MSSVVISGDTSGAITVAVPAVAGTNTVTIAAQTGTLNAAGPAFSAYASATQNLSSSTYTKIQLNTENFDTNNNFDSSTNYRFTPTVAGYYQFNAIVSVQSVPGSTYEFFTCIYKNGSNTIVGNNSITAAPSHWTSSVASNLLYLNGSTDYVELYVYQQTGSTVTTVNSNLWTAMSGFLTRGA